MNHTTHEHTHAQTGPPHEPDDSTPQIWLRALSVRQPWANAIVHTGPGRKDVDNRTARIHHTGLLAIHAALNISPEGQAHPLILSLGPVHNLHRGAVVGVVTVTGCHAAEPGCCGSVWALDVYDGRPIRWHVTTADPQPLARPVPVRGQLGVWRLPPAARDAVLDQIRVPA